MWNTTKSFYSTVNWKEMYWINRCYYKFIYIWLSKIFQCPFPLLWDKAYWKSYKIKLKLEDYLLYFECDWIDVTFAYIYNSKCGFKIKAGIVLMKFCVSGTCSLIISEGIKVTQSRCFCRTAPPSTHRNCGASALRHQIKVKFIVKVNIYRHRP